MKKRTAKSKKSKKEVRKGLWIKNLFDLFDFAVKNSSIPVISRRLKSKRRCPAGNPLVTGRSFCYSRIMNFMYRETGRAGRRDKRAVMQKMAALCVSALVIAACATGPVNIPDDFSPAELIQRAQEASDRNRYGVALQYYEALLDRNRTNIDLVCTAEYEIAFVH